MENLLLLRRQVQGSKLEVLRRLLREKYANPIELNRLVISLQDDFGLTGVEMADKVDFDRTVLNKIKHLSYILPKIQEEIIETHREKSNITVHVLYELSKFKGYTEQYKYWKLIRDNKITVKGLAQARLKSPSNVADQKLLKKLVDQLGVQRAISALEKEINKG